MPRFLRSLTAGCVALAAIHGAAAGLPRALDGSPRTAASTQEREYDVKAAYIFSLLPFTTWPASAFSSAAAPLTLCIAAPDPFGGALQRTFQNERVGSHPVVVTRVTTRDAARGCHVLFISAAADPDGSLERVVGTAPVLTIGETARFESRGGLVTFVIEQGRVRFDLNQTAAARVGIQFSSKVLQVARKVS